jgi:hypothetical protein
MKIWSLIGLSAVLQTAAQPLVQALLNNPAPVTVNLTTSAVASFDGLSAARLVFPHGANHISAAGTNWVVMALCGAACQGEDLK